MGALFEVNARGPDFALPQQWRIHAPLILGWPARHKREVFFADAAFFHELRKAARCGAMFGDEDEPAGFAIRAG